MKRIPLTQGKFALVDDDIFDELNQDKWYALKNKRTFYAVRNVRKADGKQTSLKMHRVIIQTPSGMETDHIDHNGLNNQRSNLRICTTIENSHNKRAEVKEDTKYSSNYVGVSWHKDNKKWRANIASNGKDIHLGYFNNELDAAIAYNNALKKYHSVVTRLNVI